ncbi:MAG TPA: EAL domain-containing protein [Steroidobacteraceae bacterium]|nr:EAL domain-containing protein [Steroidobacteraceae bacterium]
MAENSAVPMIVLAPQQEIVEIVNSTMRNGGIAVRCHWIRELNDLGDALTQISAQMLVAVVGTGPDEMKTIATVRTQFARDLPLVFVREDVDEGGIATAMQLGARDVVTLKQRVRLYGVLARELEAHRFRTQLDVTIRSAHEYREQLKSFMAGSADAIAHVQEGIVVDANPAWVELFGYPEADALVGQPLMDAFETDTHAALKGALVATLQDKFTAHPLRANGVLSDGSTVPLEMEFSRAEFDGEPAVRVCIAAKRKESGDLNAQLSDALERDAASGFLQRRFLLEKLGQSLAGPIKAGVRELLCIGPDQFTKITEDIGPLLQEDFVAQFSSVLREHLQPNDLAGRHASGSFLVLLERGTSGDIESWSANLLRKISGSVFRAGDKSISCTASVGIALVDPRTADLQHAVRDAEDAFNVAQETGGNKIHVIDRLDEDTKQEQKDKIWAKLIKSALMENRFRLMQQPIASLLGEDRGMFDVLVRMVNEQGEEVLPSEFIPAAERHDLMKNIDRWVIAAAMTFCASRPVKRMFVRLSKDSVCDKSLLMWLTNQLKSTRVEPGRICIQVSEQIAAEYLSDTTQLATGLRQNGFKFALEHFGMGRDPKKLLAQLPADFMKVDGTLMQGLAVDANRQQLVRELVDQARAKNMATIAERVEDANTMAVLWQLGIEFIQGYFVNEPEQVVMG